MHQKWTVLFCVLLLGAACKPQENADSATSGKGTSIVGVQPGSDRNGDSDDSMNRAAKPKPRVSTPKLAVTYEGNTLRIDRVSFTLPEGWSEAEPQARIQLTRFGAPSADGDAADALSIAVFAPEPLTDEGIREETINHNAGQFADGDIAEVRSKATVGTETIDGLEVTWFDYEGNYAGGPAMRAKGVKPQPDMRMISALIEGAGPVLHIRMLGPKASVEMNKAAMRSLVNSISMHDGAAPD